MTTTTTTLNRPTTRSTDANGMIHVASLADLAAKDHVVVQGADRPIVVFHNGGDVRAVDNRCPHMGFPLAKGTCKGGIVTCHWHHARFDADSGCAFDLFAGDVEPYDVEVRDGQVYVSPTPRPRDAAAYALRALRTAMQQNIPLDIAKSILALRSAGIEARTIVREAAEFAMRNRDRWAGGMTTLTAVANLLPHLSEETAYLALFHGVQQVAADCAGQPSRRQRHPLEGNTAPLATLGKWLRDWTMVRHRDAAERTLLTAVQNGAAASDLARLVFTAATDRFYADGGHVVDFSNKAFEVLDHVGHDMAADVLPTLVALIVGGRGGEELDSWRYPTDLVPLVRGIDERLPALLAAGRGKRWADEAKLAHEIFSGDPQSILQSLERAISAGATPVQLGKSLAYAAAMRVARFGTANEIGDWFTVLHTFSYASAIHAVTVRCPDDPLVLRGIVHGAMRVYLDRFLNVPPAKLPGERGSLDDLPSEPQVLLERFLDALDSQQQVDGAARLAGRYLSLGHPAPALIDALTRAVVREDFDFHTMQMVDAAARQYAEWDAAPEGRTILIAAARYVAAHSPTQRTLLQTARIALRLHRGEKVFEEED